MKLVAYNPRNDSTISANIEKRSQELNHEIVKWIKGPGKLGEAIYTVDQKDGGAESIICAELSDIFENLDASANRSAFDVFIHSGSGERRFIVSIKDDFDSASVSGYERLKQLLKIEDM